MKDAIIFQHRNRLKNHFVQTSNVLLWCYSELSDGARRLYQILDGFDYPDPTSGTSKGYVFPKVETLATIIGKDARSVHRYINELMSANLITRMRRRNQASIFYIEDVSEEQIQRYMELRQQLFTNNGGGSRGGESQPKQEPDQPQGSPESEPQSRTDKSVTPETTDLSIAYKEEEQEVEKDVNVNAKKLTENVPKPTPPPNTERTHSAGGMTAMADLLEKYQPNASPQQHLTKSEDEEILRRDAVANELARTLNDLQSLGCYRAIAAKIPHPIIFETLSETKQMATEGKINTKPAAYFVHKIKRYAQSKGINLDFSLS